MGLWDFTTLQQIVDAIPSNTALQNRTLVVANRITDMFHTGDPTDIRIHGNFLSRCLGRVGRLALTDSAGLEYRELS